MASGGVSKAARAAETTSRDVLGPRLARILKSGLLNDISHGSLQKAAATAGTLEAFADYSVIAQGFVNSLVNAGAFDGIHGQHGPGAGADRHPGCCCHQCASILGFRR